MRRFAISVFTLLLLFPFPVHSKSSWSYEFQLWSSPYSDEKIYAGALGYTIRPSANCSGAITIPIRLSHSRHGQKWDCSALQLSLAYSRPFGQGILAKLKADFIPWHKQLPVEGGFEILADPLLAYCSLKRHSRVTFLKAGVIFAANERWALGAHLQYGENSFLTYELHHSSGKTKNRRFSFAYSPDGSLQCLGFKIAF